MEDKLVSKREVKLKGVALNADDYISSVESWKVPLTVVINRFFLSPSKDKPPPPPNPNSYNRIHALAEIFPYNLTLSYKSL